MRPENEGSETPVRGTDDPVRQLLRLAGPRPQASPRQTEETRRAVRRHWRGVVEDRRARRRRRWRWTGLAAGLASIAVVIAFVIAGRGGEDLPGGPIPPAVVTFTTGPVRLQLPAPGSGSEGAGAAVRWLSAGGTVPSGGRLETPPGSLAALRLPGGESVRLDGGCRLLYPAAGEVEIASGAVYVDSGAPGAGVVVRTPFGPVEEVGTQFEVRLLGDGLRVRVREGRVVVRLPGEEHGGSEGEELLWPSLVAGGPAGPPRRAVLPRYGEPWAWALDAAPPRQLEGLTLREILGWVHRETGWRVELADGAEGAMERPVLGTLAARPEEAAELVLPVFGLESRYREGVLRVAPR